jgi:hypothetical protein
MPTEAANPWTRIAQTLRRRLLGPSMAERMTALEEGQRELAGQLQRHLDWHAVGGRRRAGGVSRLRPMSE